MPKYRRTWTLTCKQCGDEFKRKHFFKPMSVCDKCRAKMLSGLFAELNRYEGPEALAPFKSKEVKE